jgi:hypothetical protein
MEPANESSFAIDEGCLSAVFWSSHLVKLAPFPECFFCAEKESQRATSKKKSQQTCRPSDLTKAPQNPSGLAQGHDGDISLSFLSFSAWNRQKLCLCSKAASHDSGRFSRFGHSLVDKTEPVIKSFVIASPNLGLVHQELLDLCRGKSQPTSFPSESS